MDKLKMRVCTEDQGISRLVFVHGAFERAELEFIQNVVRKDMVVADIGANIGVHTLVLADAVGELGRLHAFEPSRAFQRLVCNVELNAFANRCQLNNVALGREKGTLLLNQCVPGREAFTSAGQPLNAAYATGAQFEVGLDTLDDYANRNGVGAFDFVKIDVEGYEVEVLEGATAMLRNRRIKILMIEFNDVCLVSSGSSSSQLYSLLRNHGLRLHLLDRQAEKLIPCDSPPAGTWNTVIGYSPSAQIPRLH
jgi:FkbM family methyltransferase